MARKKSQPKKALTPARFAIGALVRVRPGIMDPDFADIPLGGWAGTVREADRRSAPPTYLIEWDRPTLEHMHPVYRKRCERDGLDLESMWLGEDDLEPDTGGPAAIEQPTEIRTRPLNLKDQDDGVRPPVGAPPHLQPPDQHLVAPREHLERAAHPGPGECRGAVEQPTDLAERPRYLLDVLGVLRLRAGRSRLVLLGELDAVGHRVLVHAHRVSLPLC